MRKFRSNAFCSCLGSLRHVSIPGIKTISDRDQPLVLKLIWLTVIGLCFYLCINQLSGRIEYFFSYPVTLSYELRPVDRLQFPILTVCEKRTFYGGRISDSFSQVVDTCRFSGSKSCNSSEYWFSKMTARGSCFSLIIPYSYYYFGPSSGIRLTLKDRQQNPSLKWTVTINHQWDESIYDSIDKSFPIYSKLVNTITYTEKLFIHENVPVRPCYPEDDVKRCRLSCRDKILFDIVNCTLPFMTTLDSSPCKYTKTITERQEKTLLNAAPCHCGKACETRTYELQVDTREEAQFNSTVVDVYSNREEVEVLAEKRAFVLYALICEIGGTLGLFLGACLLTFIEIIEGVAAGICQRTKETRVAPLETKPPFLVYTINVSSKPAKFTHFIP